jgi:hypothetical protein
MIRDEKTMRQLASRKKSDVGVETDALYEEIGRLKVEQCDGAEDGRDEPEPCQRGELCAARGHVRAAAVHGELQQPAEGGRAEIGGGNGDGVQARSH